MATVPQIPLPRKKQQPPGEETSSNISEMRGSFRQAASEASTSVLKRVSNSLFSAIRFKSNQEKNESETRKGFRSVNNVVDNVNDGVDEATGILAEINAIQFRSLQLLRSVLNGITTNNNSSIVGGLPKTLLSLLTIAGLAGVLVIGTSAYSAAKKLLGDTDTKDLTGSKEESDTKQKPADKPPIDAGALAPKSDNERDGGGGDDKDDAELEEFADQFKSYVEEATGGKKADATSVQNPEITNQQKRSFASESPNDISSSLVLPKINTESPNDIASVNVLPQQTAITKQNVIAPNVTSETTNLANQNNINNQNISNINVNNQNNNAILQQKNANPAASKLAKSLVFSADFVTFSADEIEFIQNKAQNVKSEEIEKIREESRSGRENEGSDILPEEDDEATDSTGKYIGIPGMPGGAGPGGGAGGSFVPDGENGKLPDSALEPIGNGHRLNKQAAAAYKQMAEAAAKEGITWSVSSSYRTYDQQVAVAREKGLYSQGGLAATPGRSKHGWGSALDLGLSDKAHAWLQANAAKFGFGTIPRERWHWQYNGGGTTGDATQVAAGPATSREGQSQSTSNDQTLQSSTGAGSSGTTGGMGASASASVSQSGPGSSSASQTTESTYSSGGGTTTITTERMSSSPATPAPPSVSTGASIDNLSRSASPLRPRESIDRIIETQMQQQSAPAATNPVQTYGNSVVNDPTSAGNVEPPDGDARIRELFGDYSGLGNAGSLG